VAKSRTVSVNDGDSFGRGRGRSKPCKQSTEPQGIGQREANPFAGRSCAPLQLMSVLLQRSYHQSFRRLIDHFRPFLTRARGQALVAGQGCSLILPKSASHRETASEIVCGIRRMSKSSQTVPNISARGLKRRSFSNSVGLPLRASLRSYQVCWHWRVCLMKILCFAS
jgi:hypothetical protein